MKVSEFAFVGYPVTDLIRARSFYEEVLGFRPASVRGSETTGWVEYEIGPHTLAITNTAAAQWRPSNDGPAVALEVEDFDQAVQELREAGVAFVVEPSEWPTCRLAVVRDPDGNSIAFHQRTA